MYKWTHTIQAHIVQGLTIVRTHVLEPVELELRGSKEL